MKKLVLFLSLFFNLLFMEQGMADLVQVRKEEALRKSLLQNYDSHAKPGAKTVTKITEVTILNFDMHEADHSINLHTYFAYSWIDTRLKWSAEAHMNITMIGMDPDSIWKPDLSVYNAAAGSKTILKSQLPCLLYPDGKILFVPVYHFHFSCLMDLTYWPHDTHNCSLKLGSWIHNGYIIDYDVDGFSVNMEIPQIVGKDGTNLSRADWNLSEITAVREVKYYPCCDEPYVDVLMTLIITRNAPAYAWTVKMPAACLSVLSLVMFLLPPAAGEKLIFGGLCLILDLLYIDYTSYAINHAPSHTPLIVQLVCQQVVLLMVSLIVSAIVIRIARDPHSSGLPSIIKGPVTGMAYILCLGNYANLTSGTYSSFNRPVKADEVELGDEVAGDIRKREQLDCNEWLIFSAVIDRIFFILYFAICIISLIRFSSVL